MDKYENRRLRLLELIEVRCRGKHSTLAEKIEREASYVSRMLYTADKPGRKRIAEGMRDLIEDRFDLERGALDLPPGSLFEKRGRKTSPTIASEQPAQYIIAAPDWPFKTITPEQWDNLNTRERALAEGIIALVIAPHNPTKAVRSSNTKTAALSR